MVGKVFQNFGSDGWVLKLICICADDGLVFVKLRGGAQFAKRGGGGGDRLWEGGRYTQEEEAEGREWRGGEGYKG